MIKGASAIFIVLLFFGSTSASAEIIEQRLHEATDAWTNETGEYVPRIVRQTYIRGLSGHLASNAPGLPNIVPPDPTNDPDRRSDLKGLGSMTNDPEFSKMVLGMWLRQFPLLKVIVQPTPPKEFLLTINGEPCPATEKATYRVPRGAIRVRVWREGRPLCEKTYNTVDRGEYLMECAL
jgi:hypothetical protein